jgi:hypothetical protein
VRQPAANNADESDGLSDADRVDLTGDGVGSMRYDLPYVGGSRDVPDDDTRPPAMILRTD